LDDDTADDSWEVLRGKLLTTVLPLNSSHVHLTTRDHYINENEKKRTGIIKAFLWSNKSGKRHRYTDFISFYASSKLNWSAPLLKAWVPDMDSILCIRIPED
jgi:hypothetical protein